MSVWGEEYGFEPFRSLDGITVIMGGGGRPGAESWNGVVLSGTFAATTLAAKMKESARDASTTERYREHTIHVVPSSPEADEALKKRDRVLTRGICKVDMGVPHLSYVVFVGDHTLVGSQSKQGLVKMLDWFDRRGEALPPEQFTSLWLHYAHDLPVRVIATVMQRTQPGVKILMFRGRRTLRTVLQARGLAHELDTHDRGSAT